MTKFETGAVRDTGGKGRMDLLPWPALIRVSKHMEDALEHYPERNWEAGLPMHSMVDSAFRHLAKYMSGQTDEDHLCAAATNLLMALWTEDNKPEMQDIPARVSSQTVEFLGKEFEPVGKWVGGKLKGTAVYAYKHPKDTLQEDDGECEGTKFGDSNYWGENRKTPTQSKASCSCADKHGMVDKYGICTCWHKDEIGDECCWGTKEKDPCSCGGDRAHCSHYGK